MIESDARRSALVLTGGGARGAYQVGIIRGLGQHFPETRFPLLTGVSAGAINTASLANSSTPLPETAEALTALWLGLSPERIFRVDSTSLVRNVLRWGLRLISGGTSAAPEVHGLLDTTPLRRLLTKSLEVSNGEIGGIAENLERGRLQAFATSTVSYSTGQTVTWVQGSQMDNWERPGRVGRKSEITVDHIMASSALPMLFPAVRIGTSWYGDGGVRQHTPLGPAIHLGADKILAVSTRHPPSSDPVESPLVEPYPPPAQLAGILLNAVFLDAVDQDALQVERINRLIAKVPAGERGNFRPIDLMVLRPSVDLGRLAADFEPRLPGLFRFLTRGLGTREVSSPDVLSLLMFQSDYLSALIDIGERDVESHLDELEKWMEVS